MRALFWLAFSVLVLVRVPSLAQPAGADQGLYAYVGQRILAGDVPFRDAWDQKPPAVHYTYALMYAIWPHDAIVPAADLILAVATALVLLALGHRLGQRGAGEAAALIFVLYTNPALTRLGGVRIRAQCEVFLALAVSGALWLVWHACRSASDAGRRATLSVALAGMLFGLAFLYKYNAGIYVLVGLVALIFWSDPTAARTGLVRSRLRYAFAPSLLLLAGFAATVGGAAALFGLAGAFTDLYDATITYNLLYSAETYTGPRAVLTYLATFPIQHARLDALWFLGGLGSAALLLAGWREPTRLILPLWVGAACVSIAVNGGRGLPQYFLQAGPALALAAAVAGTLVWHKTTPLARVILGAALVIACLRITDLSKAVDYTAYDLRGLTGAISREQYLSRFGERASGDKYAALAIHELAQHFSAAVPERERVLLFGFSPGALVQSHRTSATRFFWSRPIIVGFNEGRPGYGVDGLLDELQRTTPIEVILQQHDWDPDGPDSATYFLGQPRLSAWLQAHYDAAGTLGNFLIYRRRS